MPNKQVRYTRAAAGLAALALLAGCAQNDDPRKGGFVSGLYNGVLTDGYQRRLDSEQMALNTEAGKQSALQQRIGDLQRQRRDLSLALGSAQRQATSLEGRLQSLRGQLTASRDAAKRERVESALKQLDTVNTALKTTDWQGQSVDEASSRLRDLNAMMRDITEVAEAGR
ncbi:hypothetical protein [Azospirillum palustre]